MSYVPMRVWKDYLGDWATGCRRCGQDLSYSSDWEGAMIQALGHMSLFHPQWPKALIDIDPQRDLGFPPSHIFEVPC